MHSIGKNHGRVCTSSIAVIEDANTNQARGKLMNFCEWEDINSDLRSAALMIKHNIVDKFDPYNEKNIVDRLEVIETNMIEMECLLSFLNFCGNAIGPYFE